MHLLHTMSSIFPFHNLLLHISYYSICFAHLFIPHLFHKMNQSRAQTLEGTSSPSPSFFPEVLLGNGSQVFDKPVVDMTAVQSSV